MSRLLRLLEEGGSRKCVAEGSASTKSTQDAQYVPTFAEVQAALGELRPHLNPSLRELPDEKLLALVNWNIMVAWDRAYDSLKRNDKS